MNGDRDIDMDMDRFNYSLLDINTVNNNNYNIILVPEDSYLEDTRILKDFKKTTFGNYLKTNVMKEFEKACMKCEIEKACYWGFQMLASGYINQLWDKCYLLIYKNINIENPNCPSWILEKEKLFRKIVTNELYSKDNILNTRNVQQIRNILSELITFICLSDKRKIDNLTFKFNNTEFDLKVFYSRLKYKDDIRINKIIGSNDSKEIILACNELYHCIKDKNIQLCIYWLTWINTWEKINIKKYKSFDVQSRSIDGIDNKFQRNVIWFIWNVIQLIVSELNVNNKLQENLNSLWLLYIFNWKPSHKTKKNNIIIWYILLIISPLIDYSKPIIKNNKLFIKVISNINIMFKLIKSQENTNPNPRNNSSNPSIGNSPNPRISNIATNKIGSNINIVVERNYEDMNNSNPISSSKIKKNDKKNKNKLDNTTQNKLDMMFKLDGYL